MLTEVTSKCEMEINPVINLLSAHVEHLALCVVGSPLSVEKGENVRQALSVTLPRQTPCGYRFLRRRAQRPFPAGQEQVSRQSGLDFGERPEDPSGKKGPGLFALRLRQFHPGAQTTSLEKRLTEIGCQSPDSKIAVEQIFEVSAGPAAGPGETQTWAQSSNGFVDSC